MLKKNVRLVLLVCMIILSFSQTFYAEKNKKVKNQWVKKGSNWFYYNAHGNKKKGGLKVIGKRTYYFDRKGVQRTGWRKIGEEYYFFRIKKGKAGYMMSGCTVNGIKIRKDGRAKQTTDYRKKKLEVLTSYALWGDKLFNLDMSKTERFYRCVMQIRAYPYRDEPDINLYSKDWDLDMALDSYDRWLEGGFQTMECRHYAATLAYLCNAAGIKDVSIVSHTEHSWVRVGEDEFDPVKMCAPGDGYWPITQERREGYWKWSMIRTIS